MADEEFELMPQKTLQQLRKDIETLKAKKVNSFIGKESSLGKLIYGVGS